MPNRTDRRNPKIKQYRRTEPSRNPDEIPPSKGRLGRCRFRIRTHCTQLNRPQQPPVPLRCFISLVTTLRYDPDEGRRGRGYERCQLTYPGLIITRRPNEEEGIVDGLHGNISGHYRHASGTRRHSAEIHSNFRRSLLSGSPVGRSKERLRGWNHL